MLLFVDQPKNIKILRLQEKDEGVQRIRVGTVQKNKLELNEELTNGLTTAELDEVKSVIALYVAKDAAQLKIDIARFPETVRTVVDYILTGQVNDIERRLLASALFEAVRLLRKKERNAAEGD